MSGRPAWRPVVAGRDVMSTADVCAYTGLSRAYIGGQMRDGRLKAKKHGNRWRTTKQHVDEWLVESIDPAEAPEGDAARAERRPTARRVLVP